MKQVKMMLQGSVKTFRITYQCKEYMFCECDTDPSARGFFTFGYYLKNKVE